MPGRPEREGKKNSNFTGLALNIERQNSESGQQMVVMTGWRKTGGGVMLGITEDKGEEKWKQE